jgi:hypothetical protein
MGIAFSTRFPLPFRTDALAPWRNKFNELAQQVTSCSNLTLPWGEGEDSHEVAA